MFDETQRGQSILQPKIDEIRQAFHIDWRAVTWQDLRKPLYSGLAAALYLTLKAGTQELPQTVEAQGKFWGDRYHTGGAPYNYTSTVEQMKTGRMLSTFLLYLNYNNYNYYNILIYLNTLGIFFMVLEIIFCSDEDWYNFIYIAVTYKS